MMFIWVLLGQEPDSNSFLHGGNRESPMYFSQFIAIGAHLGLFGILGALLYIILQTIEYSSIKHFDILVIVLIGLGWGILTELYQLSVSGRYASVGDVVTDLTGAVVGGFLMGQIMRSLSRRMV
jgi:VanZ family protein